MINAKVYLAQSGRCKCLILIVLCVAYFGITYGLYSGPLHAFFPIGMATKIVFWNFGVLALFITVLWTFGKLLPRRELPELPATLNRLAMLAGSLVLLAGLLLIFWIWVAPWIKSQMQSDHPYGVSVLTTGTVIQVGAGIIITVIMMSIVLWQLKGWRRQSFSLSWSSVLLTIILILLSMALCFVKNRLFLTVSPIIPTGGIVNALVAFIAQLFVNGLLEEAYYRGYLIPQLMAWVKSPLIAIWAMVVLFDVSHLPLLIIGHQDILSWWQWILWCIFPYQPTGLLYAAIYYKTRTVIPGAFVHTYTTQWGFAFLS